MPQDVQRPQRPDGRAPSVTVELGQTQVNVVPGARATNEIRVRNNGTRVDQVDLSVVGDPGPWASVEPAQLNLRAHEVGVAVLTFAPPRSYKVPAGEKPYALRAVSKNDEQGSSAAEGSVTVEPFDHIVAELVPNARRAPRWTHHELAVDNLSNHQIDLRLRPADPQDMLDFRMEVEEFSADPGTATFVHLRTRPITRFLRGGDKEHKFGISVAADEQEKTNVAGSMRQKAILPPWFLKAVALLAIALVLLKLLVLPRLNHLINKNAKREAVAATAPLDTKVAVAQGDAADAKKGADEANKILTQNGIGPLPKGAGKAATGGSGAPAGSGNQAGQSASPSPAPPDPSLDPRFAVSFIVPMEAPSGATAVSPNTMEAKKYYWISDMVLQNPRGDTGFLRIKRGDQALLEFGLENFRDLDYHFIQPLRFDRSQPLVVEVECKNPDRSCTPRVSFSGRTTPITNKNGGAPR